MFIARLLQLPAQRPDFLADIFVIHKLRLSNRFIVRKTAEAVHSQIFFNLRKVIVKQLLKCPEIIFRKIIHASFSGAYLFTGNAEWIFIGDQQKCQVVMPEVLIESIVCRHLKDTFDLPENPGRQNFLRLAFLIHAAENITELHQNGVRLHITIDQ